MLRVPSTGLYHLAANTQRGHAYFSEDAFFSAPVSTGVASDSCRPDAFLGPFMGRASGKRTTGNSTCATLSVLHAPPPPPPRVCDCV